MCVGITDEWCSLPRCSGKGKLELEPSPEVLAARQVRKIKAGEGYWSTESIKRRKGFRAVNRPLGPAFPECRNSYRGQQVNVRRASKDIREWVETLQDSDLPAKEIEGLLFSAALAADFEARTNGYSSFQGLYRDAPPMMKAVTND